MKLLQLFKEVKTLNWNQPTPKGKILEKYWEIHAYLVILLRKSQKLMNLEDLKIATIDMHPHTQISNQREDLTELETQL